MRSGNAPYVGCKFIYCVCINCVKINEKREEQGAKNEVWVWSLIRESILREGKMKGNEKIIEKLNDLLADELTAINQYIVHSEM